ncbi:MAG: type II toxin-antitoxin system prevent-host-death family antitoxin [Oscillospiraceae bacterium]|nr:type II toxin-antitoxin system prevent-host-death family antitoxin [Oscillospiraceae bacterium]
MSITSLELGRNLEKYLALAEREDVYITRDGVIVAKLTNPNQDRINAAKSLLGVLPADLTLEESREERLGGI